MQTEPEGRKGAVTLRMCYANWVTGKVKVVPPRDDKITLQGEEVTCSQALGWTGCGNPRILVQGRAQGCWRKAEGHKCWCLA